MVGQPQLALLAISFNKLAYKHQKDQQRHNHKYKLDVRERERLQKGRSHGRSRFVHNAHRVAMLGLTISRRAIQIPTKRFATRSISRPTVSFRPRASLTSDSSPHHFRLSLKTPFTRCFHHETVSANTADTPEASSERKEVEKREQDLSRYVVVNMRLSVRWSM